MYLTLPLLVSTLLASTVSAHKIPKYGHGHNHTETATTTTYGLGHNHTETATTATTTATSTKTKTTPSTAATKITSSGTVTRAIPANVQAFYNAHQSACSKVLGQGSGGFVYCGDADGAIFLKGPGTQYDNMDIDCDGLQSTGGDCGNDPSGQSETAFKDQVQKFSNGAVSDLNANTVPYVVFGNEGSSPSFDPTKFGMQPLSVMAVVCGGNLVYGIWGDTNGGTLTGEASISLGKLCFPNDSITGDSGHDANDVLYIGFTGANAVAGASYDWTATSAADFEASISGLGDQLVAGL